LISTLATREGGKLNLLRRRQRSSQGSLAEFGPALVLYFTFLVVPLLVLIRFGLATTAMYFVMARAADAAAKAPSYGLALDGATASLDEFLDSPIARVTGLKTLQINPLYSMLMNR